MGWDGGGTELFLSSLNCCPFEDKTRKLCMLPLFISLSLALGNLATCLAAKEAGKCSLLGGHASGRNAG